MAYFYPSLEETTTPTRALDNLPVQKTMQIASPSHFFVCDELRMRMCSLDMEGYKWWVEQLRVFLTQYKWILDVYVIEFFTERHWSKLPALWQESLDGIKVEEASQLLLTSPFDHHRKSGTIKRVYPLSLLAFVATAHALSVPRQPQNYGRGVGGGKYGAQNSGDVCRGNGRGHSQVGGLDHMFRRHVKLKKQHEIRNLVEEAMRLIEVTGCRKFLDIGSGQGHLARYLAYHCGLDVVTVDAVGCHLKAASKFDSEVEKDLVKKARKLKAENTTAYSTGSISHMESVIQPDVSIEGLFSQLGLHPLLPDESHLPTESHDMSHDSGVTNPRFIIVGLHTCGDLAPTILRVYAQSREVVGLLSVGCCYMKLSCPDGRDSLDAGTVEVGSKHTGQWDNVPGDATDNPDGMAALLVDGASCSTGVNVNEGTGWGYPMSKCLTQLPASHTQLSYAAREVACHSIEMYRERLVDCSHHVKVHCHRAVVETILRKHGLRRSQVRISKRISKLPFREYASAVLEGLELPLTELERCSGRIEGMLSEWSNVAVFFMLRLLLAPCVESVVLLDRLLFLREQGLDAELLAVFDPVLSPRNLLITSHK